MRLLPAIAWFACVAAAAAPRVRIELLPEAAVAGEAVTLGQLAHLESPDLALLRRLVDFPLGRVPRGTATALLQRQPLAERLRREAGLIEGDVEWRGAEATRVQPALRQVSGEQVAAAAVEAARRWCEAQGVQVLVRAPRLPRDVEVPAGEVRLQPRSLEGAALHPRMLAWVDLWGDRGFLRTVAVALELEGDFALVRPRAAAPGEPVPKAAAGGAFASAGEAVVARGEWATLHSTAGLVALESRVEVLQDGRPGQRVRVRQPGATGIVFARVLGPARLELVP